MSAISLQAAAAFGEARFEDFGVFAMGISAVLADQKITSQGGCDVASILLTCETMCSFFLKNLRGRAELDSTLWGFWRWHRDAISRLPQALWEEF